MNIEQIMSLPLAETFIIEGKAANVHAAHNMAHDALKNVLGIDPYAAWDMKIMNHGWTLQGIDFHAEFVRNPHYEDEIAQ